MDLTLTIFFLVYLAMGVGHLPGLRVDRTGAALIGAMLLIALGQISPDAAWRAVDYRTLGLLFGLMVISAGLEFANFYPWVARKVSRLRVSPKALLAIIILVATVMSSLVTKDVVAVAMTPVFCSICMARRLNPLPFLLGFCFATNVGSIGMLTGSPQNMIVAQTFDLSFIGFIRAAALPSLLSLPIIWLAIVFRYRGRWALAEPAAPAAEPAGPPAEAALDLGETVKSLVILLVVIAAFILTDLPHMLVALLGASVMLVSHRVSSSALLGRVDGGLLVLLFGLFILNAAFSATGVPAQVLAAMRSIGLDLQDPLSMLLVMAVISNLIGNNPSVMLAIPFVQGAPQPEALAAALVLGTGLSSNAVLFGSLAGIIVSEEGAKRGITISFLEFAKAGLPIAVLSLLVAIAWIVWLTH